MSAGTTGTVTLSDCTLCGNAPRVKAGQLCRACFDRYRLADADDATRQAVVRGKDQTKALADIANRLLARYEADAVFTVEERAFVDGIRCELRGLGVEVTS